MNIAQLGEPTSRQDRCKGKLRPVCDACDLKQTKVRNLQFDRFPGPLCRAAVVVPAQCSSRPVTNCTNSVLFGLHILLVQAE